MTDYVYGTVRVLEIAMILGTIRVIVGVIRCRGMRQRKPKHKTFNESLLKWPPEFIADVLFLALALAIFVALARAYGI